MRSVALNSSKPRPRIVFDPADVLGAVGLVALALGVGFQFGIAWALVVCGALLLGIGLVAAWRRAG